jgi:hypothetical protein
MHLSYDFKVLRWFGYVQPRPQRHPPTRPVGRRLSAVGSTPTIRRTSANAWIANHSVRPPPKCPTVDFHPEVSHLAG